MFWSKIQYKTGGGHDDFYVVRLVKATLKNGSDEQLWKLVDGKVGGNRGERKGVGSKAEKACGEQRQVCG